MAFGEALDRGDEPQKKLIVRFNRGASAFRVVRHSESSKKVIGASPPTPKSQRVKASRNNKRPADPEAQGVIPVIGRGPVAEGRADELTARRPRNRRG